MPFLYKQKASSILKNFQTGDYLQFRVDQLTDKYGKSLTFRFIFLLQNINFFQEKSHLYENYIIHYV